MTPKPSSRLGFAAAQHASTSQSALQYNGGAIMLSIKLHLIFWGPKGSFASSYINPINQWAYDLGQDSGKSTNEESVGSEYYEITGSGSRAYMTRTVSYGGAVADTDPYPRGCINPDSRSTPCLSDLQLQNEITKMIKAENWGPADNPSAPKSQYFIFTPNGVDSCMDSADTSCTYSVNNGFCGYHSSYQVPSGNAIVYSDIPYESGCDSGQAPSGTDGNADTDGTLDTGIHELLEAATDPGSDGNIAWMDSGGYEIGDKCDGQTISLSQSQIYGVPLGGNVNASTAWNQLIDGHTYYTQQLYSNDALRTATSAGVRGCAQRVGPSPVFAAPTGVTAGKAATFVGSNSYDVARPITTYTWRFGDGSTVTGSKSNVSHVYASPGTYTVTLTVGDSTGSVNYSTETQTVRVVS